MTQDNPTMGDLNELVERADSVAGTLASCEVWVNQQDAKASPRMNGPDMAAIIRAALTSLIAERDGLASLLRAFVNVRDQFPESVKLIDTAFDEYSPITVTVTKAQFLAARTALSLDTNKGDRV